MSTNDTSTMVNYALPNSIKFIILLVFQIPSILISIIIFIYFGHNRTRIHDYNRSILVLLVVNLFQVATDLPMPMDFFLNNIARPAASAYCTWWAWYEFSLNTINSFLMAWISIERHIFIFHRSFLRNIGNFKAKLLCILPLILSIIWGPLYYLITIIISHMCEITRYFDSLLCGLPCYLTTIWGTFDLFFNVITPVVLILIFNLGLLIRVIHQRLMIIGRVQNHLHQQRKMAFQLGMISFIYLAVWMPLSIAQLGQIYINPNFLIAQLDTFNFLVYIVPLILPIVSLLSMPKLIRKLKTLLFKRCSTAVVPFHDTAMHNRITNHARNTTAIP